MIRVNVLPVPHRWRLVLGPVYACAACSMEKVLDRRGGQYLGAHVRRVHVARPGVTVADLAATAKALGLRVLSCDDDPVTIVYLRGRRGCRTARRAL